ncbi:MAG: 2-dehydropantoate 2-reductase [Gemmatimonadetes bacterium]|nr:2-dehydropantoate 2-reductase [Gemmatimonadota bacterium]
MRFAIIGAGGVGGYYGGLLARAGHDVRFLARGEHLRAMVASGLSVETPDEAFHVIVHAMDDAAALGAVDVAIVSVKAFALDDVAPALRALANDGAAILPLLNGVDAVDRLAAAGVPRDHLLSGLTYISAQRIAPGLVRRTSPFHRVIIGEADTEAGRRVGQIVAALTEAGCYAASTSAIEVELWRKFVFIAAMAAACGLARAPIGRVRDARLGARLLDRAVGEVAAVARARGIAIAPDSEQRIRAQIDGLPDAMKPSFLLDLESGGPTELDALSGAVARFAHQAGVPTPVHDTAVAAFSATR